MPLRTGLRLRDPPFDVGNRRSISATQGQVGVRRRCRWPPNSWVNRSMANPARPGRDRKPVKRGPGKQIVEGGSFQLADEVGYIQRRAADHDGRIITIGQLVLFSTETGDAWLLDPTDRLAARLARDGESEPIHIEETDTTFAIGWKGRYRIDGAAFVYSDHDNGRVG